MKINEFSIEKKTHTYTHIKFGNYFFIIKINQLKFGQPNIAIIFSKKEKKLS